MPRRPRIDLPGYHHIVNRGVNRTKIFSKVSDKDKFLLILYKACKIYEVILHDYCLMDNHYHILVENSKTNLSLFMRQINSNYAIYYNKVKKRTGHLWQGRYSSWYIIKENYLYQSIRYIEHNPLKAKMVNSIKEYPYTLGSVLLNALEIPTCCMSSILVKQYDINTLIDFLGEKLSKQEIKKLEEEKKKKIIIKDNETIVKCKKELSTYFIKGMNKKKRNISIYQAYIDGYTQASISKEVGISDAMICVIVKGFRI